ncbi:clostripain-related cysteine peptidase [Nocardioides sp. SYSU D00038]|uniref:clostripain-related cysteine peptidase n=1 Tax=Nocardioides sp. SYSU D00038 TaxID=2812554 RepID=UPI0019685FFE|nr:clostripain-related cysteine peptidase [Nocardioides sp. SYSU D00038]
MSRRDATTARRRTSLIAATAAALVAAAVPVVVSAGTGPAVGAAPAAVKTAKGDAADWTMMIYAVGDTSNVAEQMARNLANLAAVPDASNVNVVALVDFPDNSVAGAPVTRIPGLDLFTTAKLIQLEGGRWNELRDLGEISMGRPDVLASFIEESKDRFPADKYGLTLFDHGAGYQGGYIDVGPPGTDGMSIAEIRSGIAAGLQAADLDKFDLIFHAACLMASYEVNSALAPLSDVQAASEELMIGYPVAPQGLPAMAENGSAADVGKAFIDGYGVFLDEVASQGGQTYRDLAAMSSISSEQMARVDDAMEAFADAAVAHMDEIALSVAKARADALEFVLGIPGEEDSWDLVDLGDFLRHLEDLPDEVAVARDAAFAALDAAVLDQVTGRATEQATGMNVYLPTNPRYVGSYLDDGTAPAGWDRFLTAFLEEGVESPDASGGVLFTSGTAEVVKADPNGILIEGQLQDGGAERVVDTETQVFGRMGGEDALVIALPAHLNAGGVGKVQGVWDYSVTALTDGEKIVPVSSAYQAQSGGLVGSFLAQYTTPDGATSDVGFRVLLSSEGRIESISVVDVSNNSAAPIELQDGGTLTPYLFVRSSGQFSRQLSDQSIRINDQMQVGFAKLSSGFPFEMGVVAGDASGEYDGAFVSERVR